MFQLTDVPRVLPELLVIVLALLVLGSDIFERWADTDAARRERVRSSASLAAIGLGMIFAIVLLQSGYLYRLPEDAPVNSFTTILRNLQSGGPGGAALVGAFATDHLTMIARLLLVGSALLVVLLTLDDAPGANPGEFYALILFATAGMCLMAGASEFILAFLAIELTSIPLYILAGYYRNEPRSAEAGMKYFLFGALSSAILLYGMSLAYGASVAALAGSSATNDLTQFVRVAQVAVDAGATSNILTLGMLFILGGVGYKVAVVPFHAWAPDVYQGAPTPITAFIATASKTAGFILLYRLLITAFPQLGGSTALDAEFGGWSGALTLLGLLTLIIGNLAALPQTNARRLLAYSSIAQAGFILMAIVAMIAPLSSDRAQATSALLYYLLVYTLSNIGAFGALAVVALSNGGDEMADLRGLARRNLPLAVLFAVCVLSLAGIPPLAGFFAKFFVFMAAWQANAQLLVSVGVITTVVALYYYLRLLKAMFIEEPADTTPVTTPPAIGATLAVSATLLFVLGVYPNLVLGVFQNAQSVAGG
jgi:NADH-quinone oxidoreductase subunit N